MYCELRRLTGHIPFSGATYDDIVLKNTKAKINFDMSVYDVKVSDESGLSSDGPSEAHAGAQPGPPAFGG